MDLNHSPIRDASILDTLRICGILDPSGRHSCQNTGIARTRDSGVQGGTKLGGVWSTGVWQHRFTQTLQTKLCAPNITQTHNIEHNHSDYTQHWNKNDSILTTLKTKMIPCNTTSVQTLSDHTERQNQKGLRTWISIFSQKSPQKLFRDFSGLSRTIHTNFIQYKRYTQNFHTSSKYAPKK